MFSSSDADLISPQKVYKLYKDNKNQSSIIGKTIKECLLFYTSRTTSFELETFPSTKISRQHTHFALKDEYSFSSIHSILESNGFKIKREAFLDLYFDTPDLELMKNNQWLRFRNGRWCLKKVVEELEIFFYIEEDYHKIEEELKNLRIYKLEEQKNYFEESLSNLKKSGFVSINKLQYQLPRRIAIIPTNRVLFTNEESVEVAIDTIKVKDDFYSIGHIKTKYNDEKSQLILKSLEDQMAIPARSKILTFLIHKDQKADMKELLEAKYRSKEENYIQSKFRSDQSPLIPYDKVDSSVKTALSSDIPLFTAYTFNTEKEEEESSYVY